MRIDLNADVGEGLGNDAAILDRVSSANVACGFHAGDPAVMEATVAACAARGVALGAHPGYADRETFGRRALDQPPAEVEAAVLYQIGALAAFAASRGASLRHVKPHGALYNQAAASPPLARAIAQAVARSRGPRWLVGLAGSAAMRDAAEEAGLRFVAEAFADRRYAPDGTLLPRARPGALLQDPAEAAAQAVSIVRNGFALASDGSRLRVQAETLCLHGDAPEAAAVADAVRRALEAAGVRVAPLDA